MSIFEVIGGPITHKYLMGKTKDEIATRCMRLLRETEKDARDAARYRYLRDFPPRRRAQTDGNMQPSLNDMWVAAFLNPAPGTIPTMDILEGPSLDLRVDAAIAAMRGGEGGE